MRAVLLCATALVYAAPATAAEESPARRWTVSAGWEHTSLGLPRAPRGAPAEQYGFGVTGGHTILVRSSRRLLAWTWQVGFPLRFDMAPEITGRIWGFDQLGSQPKAFSFEADVGARIWARPEGWSTGLTAHASYGFSRAMFATAVGPMRFMSAPARPAVGVGVLGYLGPVGANVEIDARYYDVSLSQYAVIWRGWAVALSAAGVVAW